MPFQRPKTRPPLAEAALFDYAVATLARRMRTVRDLRRLMRSRAEPGPAGDQTIDAIIARLIDLKYLSDTRFAADYTRFRKENQKFGQRRVQQDLMQKGVAKDLIAATLTSAYEDVDEVALARAFCERKRIPRPGGSSAAKPGSTLEEDTRKQTVRLMNRLLRAGFSSTAIFKLLRAWNVAPPADQSDLDSDEDLPAF